MAFENAHNLMKSHFVNKVIMLCVTIVLKMVKHGWASDITHFY